MESEVSDQGLRLPLFEDIADEQVERSERQKSGLRQADGISLSVECS